MYVAAHNGARILGGAERATILLLSGLQQRGHRVHLYCNDPLVADAARRQNVPAEILPLGGDIALPHALRFARVLRSERPDVLIVGTFKKLWLAALAARLAGVPRVIARIGLQTDIPRSGKYRMALRRWVDTVVVNAEAIRPAYLALPGWGADRVVTIHNGVRVPVREHEPGWLRRQRGIAADAPVVGTIARLATQKRIDRLLEVVARLPLPAHCIVAGDGELREALEASVAGDPGLRGRVHFLGHRDDIGDVLDALDLYVVSSDREGMSNAMLQALAAGVPVVSTAVSGAIEALRPFPDGDAPGVIVPREAEALRAEIATLLADQPRREQMREAALRRAREFDVETMLDRWEAVLRLPPRRSRS